jgi:hypothetical protein
MVSYLERGEEDTKLSGTRSADELRNYPVLVSGRDSLVQMSTYKDVCCR